MEISVCPTCSSPHPGVECDNPGCASNPSLTPEIRARLEQVEAYRVAGIRERISILRARLVEAGIDPDLTPQEASEAQSRQLRYLWAEEARLPKAPASPEQVEPAPGSPEAVRQASLEVLRSKAWEEVRLLRAFGGDAAARLVDRFLETIGTDVLEESTLQHLIQLARDCRVFGIPAPKPEAVKVAAETVRICWGCHAPAVGGTFFCSEECRVKVWEESAARVRANSAESLRQQREELADALEAVRTRLFELMGSDTFFQEPAVARIDAALRKAGRS